MRWASLSSAYVLKGCNVIVQLPITLFRLKKYFDSLCEWGLGGGYLFGDGFLCIMLLRFFTTVFLGEYSLLMYVSGSLRKLLAKATLTKFGMYLCTFDLVDFWSQQNFSHGSVVQSL